MYMHTPRPCLLHAYVHTPRPCCCRTPHHANSVLHSASSLPQIEHIAAQISLPRLEVEHRLSRMILDGRLSAQLDHRDDCLYIYAQPAEDAVYADAISTLAQLDKTITHLNAKAKKLL